MVLFWGVVVKGDQAATIYDGASVEFSVTRDGGGWAHAVRSCRSGTVVYVNDIRGFGFIRPADGDPQLMPQALEVRRHDDI
ncbi:hypothetical protein Tco_1534994 [Tanacetum coccineum]